MSCIGWILIMFLGLAGLLSFPFGILFWVLAWFIAYSLGKK